MKLTKFLIYITVFSFIFTTCSKVEENKVKTIKQIVPVEVFIQGVGLEAERVSFNSNDTQMVTSGGQGTTIWDLTAKREIKNFFNYKTYSMAVSKSGRFLLTADGGVIKICDLEKLKIDSLQSHYSSYAIYGIALSDDEKFYAVDNQIEIKIYDLNTSELKTEFEIKENQHIFNYIKKGLSFMPDSNDLLTISYSYGSTYSEPNEFTEEGDPNIDQIDSYSIDIWSLERKEPKFSYSFKSNFIYSWAMSKDGSKIALLTIDKHLKIIDIITSKATDHKIETGCKISDLAFRNDGRMTVAGKNGMIGIFDTKNDRLEVIETGIRSYFRAPSCTTTSVSHDGNIIAFCNGSYTVILYNIQNNDITVLADEAKSPIGVYYNAESKLNILTHDMILELNGSNLNTKDFKVRRRMFADQVYIKDEKTGITKIFDTIFNKTLFSYDSKNEGNESLEYYVTQDGNYAFKNLRENEESEYFLNVINLKDPNAPPVQLEQSNKYYLSMIRTFNDNKKAIISSAWPNLKLGIWNIQTGKLLYKLDEQTGNSRVFELFDENKFLVGVRGFIKLYDLETGKVIKTYTPKGYDGRHKDIENIAFSRDRKYFATGDDDGLITIWDSEKENEVISFKRHKHWITSLVFSPDGKSILSGSYHDKTVIFSNIETGSEIARFVSFSDGEWIVITPEGYFNASLNGAKYLNVRVGNKVYSIDNFYEKYYNPAYVASVLQGKKVNPVSDIRLGVALPPEVKIISPVSGTESPSDEVTIQISAKDMGGGIDEIKLYHNGKAISEETRGIKIVPKGNESTKSYTITLVDGLNMFKAVGFSRDRTESNSSEIIITLLAPEKDVSLSVLAVGINKYKNPALNLNYAEPDAKSIADFFRNNDNGLFKSTSIIEVYNIQATKEGILAKLKQLENTNPQDAVLIYFAGHGENINDKWYFIPHELTYPEREEDVKKKAISSDELSNSIKNIKAQKVLVLIDACKSGAVLLAFRGFEDRKALSQLSRSTGVHIVAASSKDQFATEVKELGHGVFTYTLLEGLSGKASGKGETVTVRKLMSYIEEQLPEITKKYRQEAQYPVVDSKGMDFPITRGK
ncbi:MAG: caspase family protein [Candidatus Tenebribacter davisii]|nr:caspase family protein [Candidatus Tenebribacter davisii]